MNWRAVGEFYTMSLILLGIAAIFAGVLLVIPYPWNLILTVGIVIVWVTVLVGTEG